MVNFSSFAFSLAGRDIEAVLKEGTPKEIAEHKVFPGNRFVLTVFFVNCRIAIVTLSTPRCTGRRHQSCSLAP